MAQEPNTVTGDAASPVSVTEIRSQIERTRAEMSQTIDAIQERLSPGRLITDAKQTVKDATVGRVRNLAQKASSRASGLAGQSSRARGSIAQTVKDNPVPVGILGMAATRLIVRTAKRRRRAGDTRVRHEAGASLRPEGVRTVGRGRTARFLAVAGACAACWAIWSARKSAPRFGATERSDAFDREARRPPVPSVDAQPLERGWW